MRGAYNQTKGDFVGGKPGVRNSRKSHFYMASFERPLSGVYIFASACISTFRAATPHRSKRRCRSAPARALGSTRIAFRKRKYLKTKFPFGPLSSPPQARQVISRIFGFRLSLGFDDVIKPVAIRAVKMNAHIRPHELPQRQILSAA